VVSVPESAARVDRLMKHQIKLVNKLAGELNNVRARRALVQTADLAMQIGQQLQSDTSAAVQDQSAEPSAQATLAKAQQINERMMQAALLGEKAAGQEEEEEEIVDFAGAARKIDAAVDKLAYDESTPKGRIIAAARRIAAEMHRLSKAAHDNSKVDMINSARAISSYVNTLVVDAKAVGAPCKDKRVTRELVSMAQRGRNFAIQLKILCAVKASSSSDDTTTETQLVTCAKELAHSVVRTIGDAEVAELKSR
jgi:Vinculin family